MKTVLVVTYYWPPAGGVSVQRILKLCKYLPSYGWRPVVLTVDGGNYAVVDPGTARDVKHIDRVARARGWEPHSVYGALRRLIPGSRRAATSGGEAIPPNRWASPWKLDFERFGEWIRLNFFIPDSRLGWYRPAVREGMRLLREERVDAILSTAPPFTVHLVAKRLQAESGLPWVADFRDPWVENHAYNRIRRLPWAVALNRRMESSVLDRADRVVCIGPGLAELLRSKLVNRDPSRVEVISNGYDRDDVLEIGPTPDRFYLSYFGSLYEERSPDAAFAAAKILVDQDAQLRKDFAIRIVGNVTSRAEEKLREAVGAAAIEIRKPLPSQDYHRLLYQPQVLLLGIDRMPHNGLIFLGKTFDYLPTGNPVLGVGPAAGDAARLLDDTGTGRMFDYEDVAGICAFLRDCYRDWRDGRLNRGIRSLPQWERGTQAGKLANLLSSLTLETARQPRL